MRKHPKHVQQLKQLHQWLFVIVLLMDAVKGALGADYVLLAVSGTLQDGFPLRSRLDFSEESKAVLLGTGLVRGYKAYLDIKQKGWREYAEEPLEASVNSAAMPSGCNEHANVYWIYAVDVRQVTYMCAKQSFSSNQAKHSLTF